MTTRRTDTPASSESTYRLQGVALCSGVAQGAPNWAPSPLSCKTRVAALSSCSSSCHTQQGMTARGLGSLLALLGSASGQMTTHIRKAGYQRSVESCPHGQVVSSDGRSSVILTYQNTPSRALSQLTRRAGDTIERNFETFDGTSAMLTKTTINEIISDDDGLVDIEANCARSRAGARPALRGPAVLRELRRSARQRRWRLTGHTGISRARRITPLPPSPLLSSPPDCRYYQARRTVAEGRRRAERHAD